MATQESKVGRLASTRRYVAPGEFAAKGSEQSRRPVIRTLTPYGVSAIGSARQSASHYHRVAETAAPEAAKIAGGNAGFAEQWADLAETHDALAIRLGKAREKLESTTRDYDDVNAKLTQYGLTPTIGLLLRHKKEQLDAWQVKDSQTLFASQELGRSRQEQLELEMVRYDGSDAAAQTIEILSSAGYDPSLLEHANLASQIDNLLQQRRRWLESLHQLYEDYQQGLGELDSTARASANLTEDYRNLIDRHVTWIRSDDPVSVRDVRNLDGGLAALFDSRRSGDVGPTLERKMKSSGAGGVGLLVLMVMILALRWRAKSWLIAIGRRKRMKEASADSRKAVASVLTPLVSLAIPGILFLMARWMGTGIVSEATLHASSAFYAAALVALMVEVPRQLLRHDGYLDKHVDVQLPGRRRATRYLTIVGIGLVVSAYAVTLMGLIDHGIWRGSVSRFGFMATMILVAWTAHRSLRPTGGFLEPLIAKFGGSVIHRVRFLLYLAGIGFPLTMATLAALGYGFTANELIKRAIITLVCAMIGWTLWAAVKIVSARAWKMLTGSPPTPPQYDRYGDVDETSTQGGEVSGVLADHFLELKHQLAFLCQCALVLGAIVSFGWLWIDVFPDVRMGNPVVWTVEDTTTQSSIDAAGQTVTSTIIESTPVTALHLLMAAATLFVAFQLAKLLPALWDALVLQRVSFDEGMEHFTLVLGRCILFGVGCLIACTWVGVRWQTIQWLAVGLTIGLGFGLQDMVRNLFGGLIVLFEKPARLGDLVTVGEVTGRVASQKFRTTVLSDDEGREVIVPNKKFVSEDVVNWMGAGRLTVIPIEVAVTRDERPADICRTLQELVIAQRNVLLTPAPQATLVCVSKSSQRIEVRAWIEDGQDAKRFRDSILKIVRMYLRENNLLATTQPTQPSMDHEHRDRFDDHDDDPIRDRRRRSA